MKQPEFFEARRHDTGKPRTGDKRTPFQRDRARIIHSAAFRRLQSKTQVMGVGEGDFHRTRLTHSIECAQIGNGLLDHLCARTDLPDDFATWKPDRDLIEAACFAHDIGHPPYGHGGEKSLHKHMADCGGFEGNGQTLRILCRLEKYVRPGQGIDPTRRLVLAVLKYPIQYSRFDISSHRDEPPKCYYDEERDVVDWALDGFSAADRRTFTAFGSDGKAAHHTMDCSIMELADDIAYGVHDIEDIIARKLAPPDEIRTAVHDAFKIVGNEISYGDERLKVDDVSKALISSDSFDRKQMISTLVNLFVSNVRLKTHDEFQHPLLRHEVILPDDHNSLLRKLKKLSYHLIIRKAQIQQLEQRGMRMIARVYETLLADPEHLIPSNSWDTADASACSKRKVCDYVAGMTDAYAEKVYCRLFVPGFGSSSDEL